MSRLKLIAVLGALLGSTAALAPARADFFPVTRFSFSNASACQGDSAADRASLLYNNFGVTNVDPVNAHVVHCPLTFIPGLGDPDSVSAEVYDRHPTQAVSCRVEATSDSGATFFSFDIAPCSANDLGCAASPDPGLSDTSGTRYHLAIDAVSIPNGLRGGYALRCSIPPTSSGHRSHLVSYGVADVEDK